MDIDTAPSKNVERLQRHHAAFLSIPPLFDNEEEYNEFVRRHSSRKAPRADLARLSRATAYLGIDAGSTTVKAVLLDDQGSLLGSPCYRSNSGNPVPIIRDYLLDLLPNSIPICALTAERLPATAKN